LLDGRVDAIFAVGDTGCLSRSSRHLSDGEMVVQSIPHTPVPMRSGRHIGGDEGNAWGWVLPRARVAEPVMGLAQPDG
jgi:hypothetical protein